jgi:glycerophosphoryl diester phosphodiesterase
MVEVDVRFTADHVPVIAHDSDLQRLYGVPGNVAEMTLDEISTAIAGKGALMTFEELATLCREAYMGLYLDFKAIDTEGMQQIVEIVRAKHLFSHTIFSSFRPDWVAEMKAQIPDARTSVLFSSVHVEPVALAKSVNADYVHPCWERFDRPQDYLTQQWLDDVRGAGLGIICWHEERPPVIADLKALGVDGICSDRPDLLT